MNRKPKLTANTNNMNSRRDSSARRFASVDSTLNGIEIARSIHRGKIGNVQFSDLSSNNTVGNEVRVDNGYQHQPQPDPPTDANDSVENESVDVLNRSSEENRSVPIFDLIVALPFGHKIVVAIILIMIATINIIWLVKCLLEHLF